MLPCASVKAFVLAAGFGKRLSPITETVPKALLPVGNLPLIGYTLKLCAFHGITDVVINLHHLGKAIKEALGDGSAYGVEITYSEEEEILGTGGGLKKMHDYLSDGPFVVLNSDLVFDLDLTALIQVHGSRGALATMAVREDPNQGKYGLIELDDNDTVQRIVGHSRDTDLDETTLRPFMFTGAHVLEPRFLDYIPPDVMTCVIRYGYKKALDNDESVIGFVADGYWNDAGTPSRYLQANVDALAGRCKMAHADPLEGFAFAPTKEVAEVVRMGEDVQLGTDVRLVPPVLLGDGARVGDHATVGPECVVSAKGTIGKEAKITESVVLEGAKVDSGAVVKKTVVGRKVALIEQ